MKKKTYFLLIGWTLIVSVAGPAVASVRLAVVVVVDQLRPDYFDRYGSEFKHGLKTLREQSSFFQKARYNHIPTETAPGHAVLLTGQPPAVNGIIGNEWYDRKTKKERKSITNPDGTTGPLNLDADTLGDLLKKKNPKSKVVSLSMKDRSAILSGGRSPDVALWFDPDTAGFVSSSFYPKPPSWIENFNKENRPYKPKTLLKSLRRFNYLASPESDQLLMKLTAEIARHYELGTDDDTDLLIVSFSATDYVGHRYGPDSAAMKEQLLALDKILGELLELTAKISDDQYVLALSADHGVLPVPESPEGGAMKARRISTTAFLLSIEDKMQMMFPADHKWVSGVYLPYVYLNTDLVQQMELNWKNILQQAKMNLGSVEGIKEIFIIGEPIRDPYTQLVKRSIYSKRAGDLILILEPGVLVSDYKTGTSHGSPYDYDSFVPLLFYGPSIKTQSSRLPAAPEDLVPTLSYVLKLQPANPFPGKILFDIYK